MIVNKQVFEKKRGSNSNCVLYFGANTVLAYTSLRTYGNIIKLCSQLSVNKLLPTLVGKEMVQSHILKCFQNFFISIFLWHVLKMGMLETSGT